MNILITGASRGIGRSIAKRLAADGHTIIAVARSGVELATLADEIISGGGRCITRTIDVSKSSDVEAMIGSVRKDIGEIDVLINNAGTANSAKLEDTSDDFWHTTFAINVDAAFYLARSVVSQWKARKSGMIINIASTAALRGFRYTAAYTSSKHALIGLSRALDAELSPYGISVFTICPGFVRTSILESSIENIINRTGRSREQAEADLAAMNASGKLLDPDDIAETAASIVAGKESRREIEL